MRKYLLEQQNGRYVVIGEFKENTKICHAVAVLCDLKALLDPNKNVIQSISNDVFSSLFTKIVDVYEIVPAKSELIM